MADAAATRTVLVGVDLGPGSSFDPTLDELQLLAESAGDVTVAKVTAKRRSPDPALFVGSGKADEIKELVLAHAAHGVIFDQALSPATPSCTWAIPSPASPSCPTATRAST